ncbi:MAG: transcription termination factor Rho [Planctomycetota bacterium]
MTPEDTTSADESLPFGAISEGSKPARKKKVTRKKKAARKAADGEAAADDAPASAAPAGGSGPGSDDGSDDGGDGGPRKRTRRGRRRRGGDDAGEGDGGPSGDDRSEGGGQGGADADAEGGEPGERKGRRRRRRRRGKKPADGDAEGQQGGPAEQDDAEGGAPEREAGDESGEGGGRSRRRRRNRGKNKNRQKDGEEGDEGGGERGGAAPTTGTGMFVLDKGNVSVLRQEEAGYLSSKKDIYVPKKLVQKHKLRDGMLITGPVSRGYKHKLQLDAVEEVDGHPPKHWANKPTFQNLTSVDPDFHYAVGDVTDNVSMRVVDLISPIGRGQRGLLVAPPRTGKTTIMREFAAGIEEGYPDVHLMVLLIDERPEEATDWRRSVKRGQVFVSTADEASKHHIQVAEAVWKRCMRLVEMGEDVILLLDSITRLARAYNNNAGPGKTMSGGLDSRAMERPRKIFGSARNTVEAGSLTILGTTLVETGSRLDQLVFEEFKGTGNMELVLNRKLSDRRIFPAIDIEKSGTRKEEKLVGLKRLKQIHILRRVLARMHFAEAAELLISRLMDVEKTTDFLDRFSVDPEA